MGRVRSYRRFIGAGSLRTGGRRTRIRTRAGISPIVTGIFGAVRDAAAGSGVQITAAGAGLGEGSIILPRRGIGTFSRGAGIRRAAVAAVIVARALAVGAVAVCTAACTVRPVGRAPIFTGIGICTIAFSAAGGGSAAVAGKVLAFFKVCTLSTAAAGGGSAAVARPIEAGGIIGTSRFFTTSSGGAAVGRPIFTGGFIGAGRFRAAGYAVGPVGYPIFTYSFIGTIARSTAGGVV